MLTGWNFADIFAAIAAAHPDAPALTDTEGTCFTWREFDARTDLLAADLVARGLGRQAKVAVYLRNCTQFLESYLACMKAGLVPVNVNYRYGRAELRYLLEDCDAEAVIVGAEFFDLAVQVSAELPKLGLVYVVDADSITGDENVGVVSYDDVILGPPRASAIAGLQGRRTPQDLLLLYTGGTTGRPKGVMWQQHDLFEALVVSGQQALNLPPVGTVEDLLAGLPEQPPRGLSASPLMHSTGLLNQFMVLLAGGCAVLLPARRFDAGRLWQAVAALHVTSLAIVGDAFARPMLAYLDEHAGELDLSSLTLIVSSGAMWSQSVQEGLLAHLPEITLYDAFGSSEGFGLGMSSLSGAGGRKTAHFRLGPNVRVRTDEGDWIAEGSEGVGRIGVTGALPLGYYKDPDKTASAFPLIDGVRYSIAGDYVRVLPDATLQLLGRGSACINTGGEKVFAEEVEEAIKQHPQVRDAACVGAPDPRFGSVVCALLETDAELTPASLAEFLRGRLADYKAPREVIVTDALPRTLLGKVDYPQVSAQALAATGRGQAV